LPAVHAHTDGAGQGFEGSLLQHDQILRSSGIAETDRNKFGVARPHDCTAVPQLQQPDAAGSSHIE
jgi:hypothetical protein